MALPGTGGVMGVEGLPSTMELILSSGNWVVPPGVSTIHAMLFAGGGGGSGYGSSNRFRPGGMGALAALYSLSVTPGAYMPVIIGLGGSGTLTTNGGAGVNGGVSSFATMNCGGGVRGENVTATEIGINGTATGGDVNTVANQYAGILTTLQDLVVPALITALPFPSQLDKTARSTTNHAGLPYTLAGPNLPGAAGNYGNYNQNNASGGVNGALFLFY